MKEESILSARAVMFLLFLIGLLFAALKIL
jgi:hypothetical protein